MHIQGWLVTMRSTKPKKETNNDVIIASGRKWTKKQYDNFRQYQNDYYKKSYRNFIFKLNKVDDAEIIEYLESQDNATDYMRQLVIKDMKNKK